MYCIECGQSAQAGARYCHNCGRPLAPETAPPTQAPVPAVSQTAVEEAALNPRVVVGIVGGLLLIAAVIGYAMYQGTPAAAARSFMQAGADFDGPRLQDLTCLAKRGEVQASSGLNSALRSFGFASSATVQLQNVDVTTLREDAQSADVRMRAQLRVSVLGFTQNQEIDSTARMVREHGAWRYCGDAGQTPSAGSSTSRPRVPTATPLNVAAIEAILVTGNDAPGWRFSATSESIRSATFLGTAQAARGNTGSRNRQRGQSHDLQQVIATYLDESGAIYDARVLASRQGERISVKAEGIDEVALWRNEVDAVDGSGRLTAYDGYARKGKIIYWIHFGGLAPVSAEEPTKVFERALSRLRAIN